jgi:IS30 family transposase
LCEIIKRQNWTYLSNSVCSPIQSDKEVAHIESLINNRPKKCLDSNYLNKKTPIEVASSFVALHG